MTTFHITWRPSGGRGEYEYSPVDTAFENKLVTICLSINGTDCNIPTDTFLARNGGKRRIRRTDRNDRSHLSIPNLVSALLALPKPTRDRDNIVTPTLEEGKWAVGSLQLQIESGPKDSIVLVRPLWLKPRHFTAPIDVASRIETLEAEVSEGGELGSAVEAHLKLVCAGTNTVVLENSALKIFAAFEEKYSDIPLLASLEQVKQAALLETQEDEALPSFTGLEGKKRVVAHALRERNQAVIKEKKGAFVQEHGYLFCECCGLQPAKMYGSDISSLIEAHHKVPLSLCADDEVRVTALVDLVMLCRNCHGAIHRFNPMPTLDELRNLLLMRPKPI